MRAGCGSGSATSKGRRRLPCCTAARFRIRDVGGRATVAVVYHGAVPDLFKVGRHVIVTGRLRNGVFVAKKDSLVTKCPSKYTAKKSS